MKADPYFNVFDLDILTPDKYGMRTVMPPYPDSYDIVISPADRVEMLEPTFKMFVQNKPIVRIYAGINTSGGTHDDVIRRILDSMGHVLLCESEECRQNLIRLGEEEWRIPPPFGLTHLDDIEVDYSQCPSWEYVLVLMNPITVSSSRTGDEVADAIHEAERALATHPNRHILILPPNGDLYSDVVNGIYDDFAKFWTKTGFTRWTWWSERVERSQFLGLLSRCTEFVSNSSAIRYEFPALNDHGELFNPSWRNQERTKPPKLESGGSDRIIATLKSIDWSDKDRLLRKRFRF